MKLVNANNFDRQSGGPGFPATRQSPTAMYAAFRKESRMKLVNANSFDRQSGGSARGGIFILKRQLWH
jgi:hypothetical protein